MQALDTLVTGHRDSDVPTDTDDLYRKLDKWPFMYVVKTIDSHVKKEEDAMYTLLCDYAYDAHSRGRIPTKDLCYLSDDSLMYSYERVVGELLEKYLRNDHDITDLMFVADFFYGIRVYEYRAMCR